MDSVRLVAEGLAALLALFFICNIWQKKKREARGRLPEPDGRWPIVGHLGLLTGTTPLYKTLAALSEKLGPLFSLQLGQRRAIVVSSMDFAKECFTVNDRAFAGRPQLEGWKRLGYNRAMFVFSPYGPYFLELRKIVANKLLSSQQLRLVLVVAGTESMAVTLEWALSLLLNNPHLLKKAQDELDCQVGKERQVDESDLSNLPYLQAIVKETMRLHPTGPLLDPHESTEPVQLGGFEVPVGSILFVNVWKIHHDPTLWADPEEFKPERFLSSRNEMTGFGGQDFAFLPFGSGRRICVGRWMAMQVLHLTLACLLQSFEWSTPMNEPVDMTVGHGLTLPKATQLRVLLRPRLPPHLY
ncbi:xanthotoxin 5-hydroxylase CYP82C4-like [Nymphaea colorata]|uniref:xanthotoxin 5-hydroxylase CYP82C4-like n=1 Tax=Nymphaea colorata TaxID=210225 RepID=UPI00129DBB16|nr:xanthotoxin 5-hydroxylase CYP82C4-like [Nymphaea colorata]